MTVTNTYTAMAELGAAARKRTNAIILAHCHLIPHDSGTPNIEPKAPAPIVPPLPEPRYGPVLYSSPLQPVRFVTKRELVKNHVQPYAGNAIFLSKSEYRDGA
jgi:hypothetical protein